MADNNWSIEVARPVIAQKAKQFEAALTGSPADGRIKPVGYEPWMAMVMADFQKEPKLCQAAVQAPETVWECLSAAANAALVPGAAAGKFYLIPRWSSKRSRMECTFIVGYKGLLELAYRHPRVARAEAFIVYQGEEFDWQPGQMPRHRVNLDGDREINPKGDFEEIRGAYATWLLTVPGGTTLMENAPVVEWMSRKEIVAIRSRSDSYKSSFSPWQDPISVPRMIRKCPVRRGSSGGSVPQSNDLIVTIAAENRQASVIADDMMPTAAEQAVAAASGGLRGALGLAAKVLPSPSGMLLEEAIAVVQQTTEPQSRVAEFVESARAHLSEGEHATLVEAFKQRHP